MRIYSISWFLAGFVTATVVAGSLQYAHAKSRDRFGNPASGIVVTESIQGGGRVAGRIRWLRLGPQVQLPGGTWIWCERNCAETLRANTVDFWEAQDRGGAAEPQGLTIYVWPR